MIVALSTKPISDKRTANLGKMDFKTCELTPSEFVAKLKLGHAFTAVFQADQNGIIKPWMRRKSNFNYTYNIVFDVEGNEQIETPALEEALEWMTIQPTIAYKTMSNGMEGKGWRYRLIYAFDEPFTTEAQIRSMYARIHGMLHADYKFETADNCGATCDRLFFGNPTDEAEIYFGSGRVFKKSDFSTYKQYAFKGYNIDESNGTISAKRIRSKKQSYDDGLDQFADCKLTDFAVANRGIWTRTTDNRNTFEYNADGVAFTNGQLYEIRYRFNPQTQGILKRMDGEGRRKQLCVEALVMLKIKPEIEKKEMVWNLAESAIRTLEYNNPKDPIKMNDLINIARWAFANKEQNKVQAQKQKFVIDRTLTKAEKAVARGKGTTELHFKEIEKYFNPEDTFAENLKILRRAYKKNLAAATLRKFYEARGIKMTKNIDVFFEFWKANRANKWRLIDWQKAFAEASGQTISASSLCNWMKQFEADELNEKSDELAAMTIQATEELEAQGVEVDQVETFEDEDGNIHQVAVVSAYNSTEVERRTGWNGIAYITPKIYKQTDFPDYEKV